MIRKQNIGLIIDTNILNDVIKSYASSDMLTLSLESWIKQIIFSMDRQPRGKIITVFASTDILRDYKTSLYKTRHKPIAKTILHVFDHAISQSRLVPDTENMRLSLRKVHTLQSGQKLHDKRDQKFLDILESVLANRKWSDRAIIFASRDKSAMDDIKFSLKLHGNVYFADTKDGLDQLIAC